MNIGYRNDNALSYSEYKIALQIRTHFSRFGNKYILIDFESERISSEIELIQWQEYITLT